MADGDDGNHAERTTVDIVVDDLERIKEETRDSFDMGCLAGAVDLIRELALKLAWTENIAARRGEENERLRAKLADLVDPIFGDEP